MCIPWHPPEQEQSSTKTLKDAAHETPEALTRGTAAPPLTIINVADFTFQKQMHTARQAHSISFPNIVYSPNSPSHSTLRGCAKNSLNQSPHSLNQKRKKCCKILNDHCDLWNDQHHHHFRGWAHPPQMRNTTQQRVGMDMNIPHLRSPQQMNQLTHKFS